MGTVSPPHGRRWQRAVKAWPALVVAVVLSAALISRRGGANLYGERLTLDDEARASLPGQFVRLPDGVVHYELAGPEEGRVVVLVHGFSVPSYAWDHTVPALAQAGFRVLRYDLYGRGYSDRPDMVYDEDLFDRQLEGLLSALEIDGPVDLAGWSMGGTIAVTYADRHPERVSRLSLISPAGIPSEASTVARLLRTPVLGEALFALAREQILLGSLGMDFYEDRFPEYHEQYAPPMRYKGFTSALLSTMRHMPLESMAGVYERVAGRGHPIQLIWGRKDRVNPFTVSEKARQAVPQAEFHPIEKAGHAVQYERPEVVNPLLIEFLQRAEPSRSRPEPGSACSGALC